MNLLPIALVVNLIALGVTFSAALVLFFRNAGSRTLALATATLLGAIIFFYTQLQFELKESAESAFFNTELTIDRSKPEIRRWAYIHDRTGNTSAEPINAEPQASAWLLAKNAEAFQQDRARLTSDLVLFSLVYFLETPDAQPWEMHKHVIGGKLGGGVIKFLPDRGRTCQVLNGAEIKAQLSQTQNIFAGAPLPETSVCLPPGSTLQIGRDSLTIHNRQCEITFRLEPRLGVTFLNPGSGEELPKLANGEAQFETRAIGINVEITHFALWAQNRDAAKYREWATGIVNGVGEWFSY